MFMTQMFMTMPIVVATMVQATAPLAPIDRATAVARHRRVFTNAGFGPIAEAERGGRRVRQLVLWAPSGGYPVPGLEIARERDGRVTMRVQYPRWRTDPVPLPRRTWRTLMRHEQALLKPRPIPVARAPTAPAQVPRPGEPPPPPPPPCEGWEAHLAGGRVWSGWWRACDGIVDPARDYAISMVTAALATRPACRSGGPDVLEDFAMCFIERHPRSR